MEASERDAPMKLRLHDVRNCTQTASIFPSSIQKPLPPRSFLWLSQGKGPVEHTHVGAHQAGREICQGRQTGVRGNEKFSGELRTA